MTKSDDLNADRPSDGAILLKRALICIFGGLALIFLAGVLAGYLSVAVEQARLSLVGGLVLALIVGLIALVAYAMWRFWPSAEYEPVAPRIRSARNLLLATCALGVPLGIVLGISDGGIATFMSNGSVAPGLAALAIVLWLAVFLLSWLWWRRIDEHEAGAYSDGALVAAHAYLLVTPIWWMATRAGWLPPQDPMLVFLAVTILWSSVWFARRYM